MTRDNTETETFMAEMWNILLPSNEDRFQAVFQLLSHLWDEISTTNRLKKEKFIWGHSYSPDLLTSRQKMMVKRSEWRKVAHNMARKQREREEKMTKIQPSRSQLQLPALLRDHLVTAPSDTAPDESFIFPNPCLWTHEASYLFLF